MLTTVPRLSMSAGKSACVIAMWPKRFTSNSRRHSESGNTSTGALTPMPALLTRARSGRPSGSLLMKSLRSCGAESCRTAFHSINEIVRHQPAFRYGPQAREPGQQQPLGIRRRRF